MLAPNKITVFVDGPFNSACDLCAHLIDAHRMFCLLVARGYAPICPHLTAAVFDDGRFDQVKQEISLVREDDAWEDMWDPWVLGADLFLRLPGHCGKADRRVALALRAGVPVYYSADALAGSAPHRKRLRVPRPDEALDGLLTPPGFLEGRAIA